MRQLRRSNLVGCQAAPADRALILMCGVYTISVDLGLSLRWIIAPVDLTVPLANHNVTSDFLLSLSQVFLFCCTLVILVLTNVNRVFSFCQLSKSLNQFAMPNQQISNVHVIKLSQKTKTQVLNIYMSKLKGLTN